MNQVKRSRNTSYGLSLGYVQAPHLLTKRCVQKKINLSKTARKMPITADMETLGSSIRDESLPMPKYDEVCPSLCCCRPEACTTHTGRRQQAAAAHLTCHCVKSSGSISS